MKKKQYKEIYNKLNHDVESTYETLKEIQSLMCKKYKDCDGCPYLRIEIRASNCLLHRVAHANRAIYTTPKELEELLTRLVVKSPLKELKDKPELTETNNAIKKRRIKCISSGKQTKKKMLKN